MGEIASAFGLAMTLSNRFLRSLGSVEMTVGGGNRVRPIRLRSGQALRGNDRERCVLARFSGRLCGGDDDYVFAFWFFFEAGQKLRQSGAFDRFKHFCKLLGQGGRAVAEYG